VRYKTNYKQGSKTAHSAGTRTSYQKVDSGCDARGQNSRFKVGGNKRLVKRKLLIQLALLGWFVWLLIIVISSTVNKAIKTTTNNKALSISQPFERTSSPPVSSMKTLYLTANITAEHTRQANTEYNHAEANDLSLQKQRLQALRMHNVLRNASKQLTQVESNVALNTYYFNYSEGLSIINTEVAIQKSLVKRWENEFVGKGSVQ
jgi:cytochrome c biogenesis factor